MNLKNITILNFVGFLLKKDQLDLLKNINFAVTESLFFSNNQSLFSVPSLLVPYYFLLIF